MPQKREETLHALDQVLRRHISELLQIDCDDWQVSNLIYDAIQNAARSGQACRSLQQKQEPPCANS